MTRATWIDGIAGYLEVTVEAEPVVILRTSEDVADFVQRRGDSLNNSVLFFLGKCFGVMCFASHMKRINDPVQMKDLMKRIMDAAQPYLGALEKLRVFDDGSSRVLDIIRSNIHADFSALLRIMVDELVPLDHGNTSGK